MRHLSLYIMVFLLARAMPATTQSPVFRPHQPRDWGALRITAWTQDGYGACWLGTSEGILRYDGTRYEQFPFADSTLLKEGAIRSVFTRNDTLWVGWESGAIGHGWIFGKNIQRWKAAQTMPDAPVTAFLSDSKGCLWIATYGEGLYVFDGSQLLHWDQANDGLSSNDVYAMTIDAKGRIWAATDNGISICSYQPADGSKNIILLTETDGLPDKIVTALTPDATGNMWVGTHDRGVALYDVTTGKCSQPIDPTEDIGPVRSIAVYSTYEIWIASAEKGLLRGNLGTKHWIPVSNERVKHLFTDREGLLWLLTDQGAMYSANTEVLACPSFQMPVQASWADPLGRIWAGTSKGLFLFDRGTWTPVNIGNVNVISLAEDAAHRLWVGTFGNGVIILDSQEKTMIKKLSLPNGSILSMAAQGEKMWVATLDGTRITDIHTFLQQPLSAITGVPEADKYYVYKIFQDREQNMWLATDGHGLCQLKHGAWSCSEEGGKTIYSIAEDHQGTLWFSGDQTGLLSLKNGHIARRTTKDRLHSNDINSLSVNGRGQLIIGYNDGIDIFQPETGHLVFLNEYSGIPVQEAALNAAATDRSGHVWMGTDKGLLRIAAFSQMFAADPALSIRSVNQSGTPVDWNRQHDFAWNENYLSIEYSGIWHTAPGNVQYRHRLEGFSPDWTLSKDQQVAYPQLPPGHYRFVVQATEHRNFDGVQEVSWDFTIHPPFWKRWWFLTGMLLLLSALLYFGVRRREKRIALEQQWQNEKTAAQLELLKSQINPHFLFNSFNTLIAMIEEQPVAAVDYAVHLSDFYRSITAYREKETISWTEELEIAQNFVFLLQKRFEEALHFTVEMPPHNDFLLIPLSLQLLIENAVKHNVVSKSKPLQITVAFGQDNTLVVQNNIAPKLHPEPGTGFGLQHLSHRYRQLTRKNVQYSAENGVFVVKIPLIRTNI